VKTQSSSHAAVALLRATINLKLSRKSNPVEQNWFSKTTKQGRRPKRKEGRLTENAMEKGHPDEPADQGLDGKTESTHVGWLDKMTGEFENQVY